MADYYKGTTVRCSVTFTDRTGGLIDPTAVAFKLKRPKVLLSLKGTPVVVPTIETYDPSRESVGVFFVDLIASIEGRWFYRFEASGNVVCAVERAFDVLSSSF